MTTLELLKNYRKRAKRNAVLKSVLCGVMVGFGANFLLAFILLFCRLEAIYVLLYSIIPGAAVGFVAAFLFYFLKFSPTAKKVAAMVDDLGLEERVITMLECEGDASEIARLQRKDATEKLNKVNPNMFRFSLPLVMIVALISVCILSISMTTVSAINSARIAPSGNVIENHDPDSEHSSTLPEEEPEYVELNYYAGEGGTLMGETYQRIEKGTDATPVVAVADEGYVFDQWDDGVMTSERWDWSVVEDLNVTAIFIKSPVTGQGGEGEGEGEGEGQGEGEGEGEGEGQGEGEGEGQGEGEGEGEGEGQGEGEGEGKGEGEGEGQGEGQGQVDGEGMGEGEGMGGGDGNSASSDQQTPSGGGGGGAGMGAPTDNNSVIDGSTDYKDATDYEAEKEAVENDDSLPPELKDALSGYFDGMKP